MQTIDVIIAGELEEELTPHEECDLRVDLRRWDGSDDADLTGNPQWAFVDWLLPDMSGLEICRRLRCNPRTANVHITLILDEDNLEMRRRALRAGADDYMVGPATREAVLRRTLASRRSGAENRETESLSIGDLAIDLSAYQARWQGKPISLMPNEFRLLRHFAENCGRVFTRSQLIAALAKQEPPVDERTVDVWIVRLRRALRAAGASVPLRTVRSLGYVLDRA
jgi:two-component system phosphate regulon response regulator PhoB